jgi:hypothetical protein
MGLINWVWDYHQHGRIRDAQAEARRGASSAESARSEVADLGATVDRLTLANQAMWELLREKHSLSDADLAARVEEIDMRDGVRDGRVGRSVANCPQCGRPNRDGRRQCLYCGTDLPSAIG